MAGLLSKKVEYNEKVKSISFVASSLVFQKSKSNTLNTILTGIKPFVNVSIRNKQKNQQIMNLT